MISYEITFWEHNQRSNPYSYRFSCKDSLSNYPPLDLLSRSSTDYLVLDKQQFIELLETQFGIYMKENEYTQAFDYAIQKLDSLEIPPGTDMFYPFLHILILDILQRLDKLELKLQESND